MNGSGARQLTLCGTLIFQVVFPSLVLIRLKVLCTPGEELQAWASAWAIVCRPLFFFFWKLKCCQGFSARLLRLLKLCLGQTSCKCIGIDNFKVTHWLKCVYEAASLPLFDFNKSKESIFFSNISIERYHWLVSFFVVPDNPSSTIEHFLFPPTCFFTSDKWSD